MMKVCIFTVIKNERDYLDDFIKYHRELGIDIFLFEDINSCSHFDIISKYNNVYLHSVKELYSEEEIPQLIEDKKNLVPKQTDYINRGLKFISSLNRYDWTALIDIDEYITCTEKFPEILNRYKEHDSVLLYWQNYGCSGHIYKPVYDKPIWEIYKQPCGYELFSDYKFFKITKFCINMRKYKPTQKYWIHMALVNWVKADGTFKRTKIVHEPLYLRHYITKSVEEFCWKVWVRGMHHQTHRQWRSLFEMCPEIKEKIDRNFLLYFRQKYGVDLPEF